MHVPSQSRFSSFLTVAATCALLAACGDSGPVEPVGFDFGDLPGPQLSIVPNSDFDADEPRSGVFTVCKVGVATQFEVTVGAQTPFLVDIGDRQCVDVVTDPGPDVLVTIREIVPDGYRISAVWAQGVTGSGQVGPWEDHGTENPVSGVIATGKAGCVVVFFNERIPTGAGAGTPGYWKQHPEAWPNATVTVGGTVYTLQAAIDLMMAPTAGNKWLNMFEQVVAAKLNLAIGTDPSCISVDLAAADTWLGTHEGTRVRANSDGWQSIEATFEMIDAYNNGELCAPKRD